MGKKVKPTKIESWCMFGCKMVAIELHQNAEDKDVYHPALCVFLDDGSVDDDLETEQMKVVTIFSDALVDGLDGEDLRETIVHTSFLFDRLIETISVFSHDGDLIDTLSIQELMEPPQTSGRKVGNATFH